MRTWTLNLTSQLAAWPYLCLFASVLPFATNLPTLLVFALCLLAAASVLIGPALWGLVKVLPPTRVRSFTVVAGVVSIGLLVAVSTVLSAGKSPIELAHAAIGMAAASGFVHFVYTRA